MSSEIPSFKITYYYPPPSHRPELGFEVLATVEFPSATELLANLPTAGDLFHLLHAENVSSSLQIGSVWRRSGLIHPNDGRARPFLHAEVYLKH